METKKIIVECDYCNESFETDWVVGSMVDWECENCGKRLGMHNAKPAKEE